MKMKSVLASIGACAIAMSAMAITASAKITNANSDNNYKVDVNDVLPTGCKLSDVYGFQAEFEGKVSAEGDTNVGAFCWQSDSVSWTQAEFCQEGGDKDIVIDANNTVKVVKDAPIYGADDTWGQVFIAQWAWANDQQIDFSVKKITLLDKDGNELKAADAAPAETTTSAEAESTTTASTTAKTTAKTTKADANKTGDAGVALAIAGLAIAGATAYITRKKD